MSSLSHPCTNGLDWSISSPLKRLKKSLAGFFKSEEITRTAKIHHGKFSYDLVPNTAIKDFFNMTRATSLDTGDCYVCVFEEDHYQGQYQIIGPGEKVELGSCGSIIVTIKPIAMDAVRNSGHAPAGFWELSGPMYIFHFSSGYKYA